ESEARRHVHDRAHDVIVRSVGSVDERPIDFYAIDWKELQIAQRRTPRAEVIEHQADAHAVKSIQNLARGTDITCQIAFRELKSQRLGWQPRLPQDVGDVLDEMRILEHGRGEVYAHVKALLRLHGSTPLLAPRARSPDHPPTYRHDQVRVFGDRKKTVRG